MGSVVFLVACVFVLLRLVLLVGIQSLRRTEDSRALRLEQKMHIPTTPSELIDTLSQIPLLYREWWLNLYHESPQHIFIETALVVFIIWLLFIRRTVDPNKIKKNNKLNQSEIDWLIETWQPEPLAAKLDPRSHEICHNIVVSLSCLFSLHQSSNFFFDRLWKPSMATI
jgi:hypothetical protein